MVVNFLVDYSRSESLQWHTFLCEFGSVPLQQTYPVARTYRCTVGTFFPLLLTYLSS